MIRASLVVAALVALALTSGDAEAGRKRKARRAEAYQQYQANQSQASFSVPDNCTCEDCRCVNCGGNCQPVNQPAEAAKEASEDPMRVWSSFGPDIAEATKEEPVTVPETQETKRYQRVCTKRGCFLVRVQ